MERKKMPTEHVCSKQIFCGGFVEVVLATNVHDDSDGTCFLYTNNIIINHLIFYVQPTTTVISG